MKKKQQVHVYEVYTKLPSSEILYAKKRIRNPRLRIDGNEQPILAADKLMRGSYGRDVIIPRYEAPKNLDIHQLKPAE